MHDTGEGAGAGFRVKRHTLNPTTAFDRPGDALTRRRSACPLSGWSCRQAVAADYWADEAANAACW